MDKGAPSQSEGSFKAIMDGLIARLNPQIIWAGYHRDRGWVLLDRKILSNKPGAKAPLVFLECDTWTYFELNDRSAWETGNHPESCKSYLERMSKENPELAVRSAVMLRSFVERWEADSDIQRQELDRQLARQRIDQELPDMIFAEPSVPLEGTPPPLNETDEALIRLWARGSSNPHELQRLQSARRAELALVDIYRAWGRTVKDVSVWQATRPFARDWKDYDLRVDDTPVDVKNARTSFSNPETYSEHCVPAFKETRSNDAVRIAGVLSPYVEGHGSPQFLGETSWREIQSLNDQFSSDYLSFDFRRPEGATYLPPWLFEYPDYFYRDRIAAIADFKAIVAKYGNEILAGQHNPALEILAELNPASEKDNQFERVEAELLITRLRQCGRSRQVLFMHVLDRCVKQLLLGEPFAMDWLRQLIFVRVSNPAPTRSGRQNVHSTWRTKPLGLDDPLETVASLLDVLEDMQRLAGDQLARFKKFRMPTPGILKAAGDNGGWPTIFAYCGGWRPTNRGDVKCGANPIYLGQSELCPECDYLICHRCGTCRHDCPRWQFEMRSRRIRGDENAR